MNEVLKHIFLLVALIPMGVSAAFLLLLNYIKQESEGYIDDKTKEQIIWQV